jgi:excinuclease ABC subunit C
MDGLFACRAFTGFGPNRFDPAPEPAVLHAAPGQRPGALRACVRESCPRRPGVYGMVNAAGALIYVGKAKCLRSRLLSYFRPGSRDPKAGRILDHTQALAWEYAPSEFAALLRELELIRRWQPRFNVQGQPHRRRRAYVCLGRRPASYAFLARRPATNVVASFGPVPGGRRAREAIRRLNDWFQLRDCPQAQEMIFADQAELFPVARSAGCLRFEIGTCLGPCLGACSRAAYAERVRAARAFLEGADRAPLEGLERAMTAASAALAFERAAALRDRLDALRWLGEELARVRRAREQHSFIYPVCDSAERELWYLIHRGRVVGVMLPPRTAAEQARAAERIASAFGAEDAWTAPSVNEVIDGVLLIAAWFRRHPEERARTRQPAEVLAACRQGAVSTVAFS